MFFSYCLTLQDLGRIRPQRHVSIPGASAQCVLYCTVQCIQCTLYTGAGKGNGKFSLVVFAWKDSGNRTIGVALFHKGIFTCVCVAKMSEGARNISFCQKFCCGKMGNYFGFVTLGKSFYSFGLQENCVFVNKTNTYVTV